MLNSIPQFLCLEGFPPKPYLCDALPVVLYIRNVHDFSMVLLIGRITCKAYGKATKRESNTRFWNTGQALPEYWLQCLQSCTSVTSDECGGGAVASHSSLYHRAMRFPDRNSASGQCTAEKHLTTSKFTATVPALPPNKALAPATNLGPRIYRIEFKSENHIA